MTRWASQKCFPSNIAQTGGSKVIASIPIIRTPCAIRCRVASAVMPQWSVRYRSSVLYAPAPVWAMFEKKKFWEAHRVMWDEEYWHLENLMNLEQIGRPFGFQLCVLPIKWTGTTAAPVRAVAIVED